MMTNQSSRKLHFYRSFEKEGGTPRTFIDFWNSYQRLKNEYKSRGDHHLHLLCMYTSFLECVYSGLELTWTMQKKSLLRHRRYAKEKQIINLGVFHLSKRELYFAWHSHTREERECLSGTATVFLICIKSSCDLTQKSINWRCVWLVSVQRATLADGMNKCRWYPGPGPVAILLFCYHISRSQFIYTKMLNWQMLTF